MCGIFGYIGKQNAASILVQGLHALEYRGYDSSGMFVYPSGVIKSVGAVQKLEDEVPKQFFGTVGIAHTRWATHGKPTKENAHPHTSCNGKLWLAHNGIVENYKELKETLEQQGHTFLSDTDSEVLVHLIEEKKKTAPSIERAVRDALREVQGTYGLVVIDADTPDKLVATRFGSPLVLGVGEGEYFISSDAPALVAHTRNVLYLQDGDVAVLRPDGYSVTTEEEKEKKCTLERLTLEVQTMQKGGFEHFMLKEIMEIPDVITNSMRGRIDREHHTVRLGGLDEVRSRLPQVRRAVIVGCGSAYYAGLLGRQMFAEFAGIPASVELASEFVSQHEPLLPDTVLIAVSQSGETADTLQAVRYAKKHGLLTLGIVNAVGSSIARETDAGVYNHAGPEISVASTKAFVSQVEVLLLLALSFAETTQQKEMLFHDFAALPEKVAAVLRQRHAIQKLAEKYAHYNNMLFIGRKYQLPTALEGALKLKEVSYIHAEGYGAGEMKHGPLAMINADFPTVALVTDGEMYQKTFSNLEEICARDGKVIAIATEGNTSIGEVADDVIYIPKTQEVFAPIVTTVALQLFAYYVGCSRGINVDKPRNLAKSVTVE